MISIARWSSIVSPKTLPLVCVALPIFRAAPGDVVCVRSPDHGNHRLRITRSGTLEAPIKIVAAANEPVLTAGFVIEADYVTVEGFEVRNADAGENNGRGYGIYIAGTGVKVIGNSVIDSEYDGSGCELCPPSCIDVTIARNIVRGANWSGIVMGGRDSVVEGNEVYGSVSKGDQGADGISFFGVNLTLRGNYIHDISAAGYSSGQEPHTRLFSDG
jgi:Right handed beta helix region